VLGTALCLGLNCSNEARCSALRLDRSSHHLSSLLTLFFIMSPGDAMSIMQQRPRSLYCTQDEVAL
jgi:hypothetical protein